MLITIYNAGRIFLNTHLRSLAKREERLDRYTSHPLGRPLNDFGDTVLPTTIVSSLTERRSKALG